MKFQKKILAATKNAGYNKLAITILLIFFGCCNVVAQDVNTVLWYTSPATKWTDALPIGNGRLGAMVYGGIRQEHLQFNEETLWSGSPRMHQRKDANKYLKPIRDLLNKGKQEEAETLAGRHFMGTKDIDDSTYAMHLNQWLSTVRTENNSEVAGISTAIWKEMQLPTVNGWEAQGLPGLDGAVWFKIDFVLPQAWNNMDVYLDLGRIRDVDFTYINDLLIGSSEGISAKRHYKISASLLKVGTNEIKVQVINYFDKGGFTGLKSGRPFVVYPTNSLLKDTLQLSGTWKYWIQNSTPPAYPQYQASYQPFADVFFDIDPTDEVINYRRDLDIGKAISMVSYTSNGVQYNREYFASTPDNIIAMHFAASKKASINLSTYLSCEHKGFSVKKINDTTLALYLQVRNGALRGVAYLRVCALGGNVDIVDNKMYLRNVDEATFYLAAATNYEAFNDVSGNAEFKVQQALKGVFVNDYTSIKDRHVKDYSRLFKTFSVDFGTTPNSSLPTDKRIVAYTKNTDPGLMALYMQYARYLLIASSRPGTQPANLQGIWNDNLVPPWGSKYTTNINLEMNYWPANVLNLAACNEPLFSMLKELSEVGATTAKAYYNARGWVLHHNTDIWRGTAPINASNHGIWPTGAAWLSQHIWQHYLFTNDTKFLQRNFDIMKGAALFFLDYLVLDSVSGYLISTPSNSPEHGGLVAGPTMDHQIIRQLFFDCIAASKIIKVDPFFVRMMKQKMDSIAPNKVGLYGELQEWLHQQEDTLEHHRHESHLWGVYPGNDIRWNDTAIMQAAKQSLLYRGDDGTGWSLAWKVNLWARFKDGDHAQMMVDKLLSAAEDGVSERGGVYKNLFDAHPPFQIDGNFGGAAGIAEMIVQSQNQWIELLPALPSSLANGEIKGICTRKGFELDIKWQHHKLTALTVYSKSGNICEVKYGNITKKWKTQAGKSYKMSGLLKISSIQ